jgi:hypothetical protein
MLGAMLTFPVPMLGAAVGGTMGAMAARLRAKELRCRKHLVKLIARELGSDYHVLANEPLLQMRLVVMLRNELAPVVSEVDTKSQVTSPLSAEALLVTPHHTRVGFPFRTICLLLSMSAALVSRRAAEVGRAPVDTPRDSDEQGPSNTSY